MRVATLNADSSDGLDPARGIANGMALALVFFWLPLVVFTVLHMR